ncbi:lipase secretion chaperone [Pseudomonas sp. MYb185]|uniref:lipase secretion chaperone n=1 Tax=Pseudomonas sp. MYb185 TaxID=1848729 RepID=UPI000CFD7B11|nr:lipase secretion chaperone [Pseudomonas sp. MYb185]PRB77437.1 lipase chaperone [Pseudomonas sp. MYb185]
MKAVIYAPLLISAALLGWHFLGPADGPATQAPLAERSGPQQEAGKTILPMSTSAARQPATVSGPAPTSLRDTAVDGMLEVDHRGNLLITDQIRHLFDYFFTTVGEESFDSAAARIRHYLASQLRQPAQDQALDLLERYIEYKTELVALEEHFPVLADLDELRAREDAVQRLRAGLFNTETHAAFFAAEEVYNSFTLERLAILHDDSLADEDKAGRIEALRNDLPEAMQDLLVPQIHQELSQQTRSLQEQGASPEQIQQLRLNLVGPEATGRLETLDRQRQQWQQRLEDFNHEREAILQHPGLADSDKQQAIDSLLEEQFEPSERLRVSSLLDNR